MIFGQGSPTHPLWAGHWPANTCNPNPLTAGPDLCMNEFGKLLNWWIEFTQWICIYVSPVILLLWLFMVSVFSATEAGQRPETMPICWRFGWIYVITHLVSKYEILHCSEDLWFRWFWFWMWWWWRIWWSSWFSLLKNTDLILCNILIWQSSRHILGKWWWLWWLILWGQWSSM